jgi:hypothetical protein
MLCNNAFERGLTSVLAADQSICSTRRGVLISPFGTHVRRLHVRRPSWVAIAWEAGWPILINPGAIILACGFAALVGIFFGLTPRIVPLASTQLSLYGTNDQLPSGLFVCRRRAMAGRCDGDRFSWARYRALKVS